jgi:uncharacterized repeat protein (TIGR02543 family)
MKHYINMTLAAALIIGMSACVKEPVKNQNPDQTIEPGNYAITFAAADHGTATAMLDGAEVNQAAAGDIISIEAIPANGYEFDAWSVLSTNVVLEDATGASTSFTMPEGAVELQATFVEVGTITRYPITLEETTGGTFAAYVDGQKVTSAEAGLTVNVKATPSSGYVFSSWTATGATISPADAADASFTMPEGNVSVKANFSPKPARVYNITLEILTDNNHPNGNEIAHINCYVGSGKVTSASAGTEVHVYALSDDANYKFNGWTISDGVTIAPVDGHPAYFTMPDHDVTVTANFRYEEVREFYNINYEQTTGGTVHVYVPSDRDTDLTQARLGANLHLVARPQAGYRWVQWECSSNVRLNDPTQWGQVIGTWTYPATFSMPNDDITIKALFEPVSNNIRVFMVGEGTAEARVNGVKVTKAAPGETVTLVGVGQATVTNGEFSFSHWESNSSGVYFANHTSATTTISMPDNNIDVYAHFKRKEPTGSDTPDQRFLGTWKDATGATVTIGANSMTYLTSDGKSYDLSGMKWNAVNNTGSSASQYPTGYRLEAGMDGGSGGVFPRIEDGRQALMGAVVFGWWYINSGGTAIISGRNPVWTSDYGDDSAAPYGPYLKQ